MYSPKSSKVVFAVTVVLVALTWLSGLFVPSHVALDEPRWAPFPSGEDAWTLRGWREAVTFHEGVTLASSAAGVNHLSFAVPLERPLGDDARVRLTGRLVEERRQGRSWATAALGVSFVSAAGDAFGYRNLRFVPRRATTLERFSEVVEWPSDAREVRVSLYSRPGAPTFSLVEGSAELVERNPYYVAVLTLLAGLAAVWVVVLARFASAHGSASSLLVPGAVAVAIVAGVTLSSQALRPVLMPLLIALEGTLGVARDSATIALLKGGHALAFFLLTFGLLYLRRKIRVRRTHLAVFAALIAIGSEGLQSHLSERAASVWDVLIDLAGVLAALVAFQLLVGASRRRRKKKTSHQASAHADVPATVSDAPVNDEPPATLMMTMAMRAPDIDLGSLEPVALGASAPGERREKRRSRSRRRVRAVRRRMSRVLG